MVIPTIFTERAPDKIASYDWYDFASGAAYKTFYCGGSKYNGSYTLFLTDRTIPSSVDADVRYVTSGNESKERNFDLTFNTPMTVSGTAIISYTLSTTNPNNATVEVEIFHVNGAAVETSLGSRTAETRASAAGTTIYRESLTIALTQKAFAIGDKLRIELTLTGSNAASGIVYYDPDSRQTLTETSTSATIGTDFVVNIPFKVQL